MDVVSKDWGREEILHNGKFCVKRMFVRNHWKCSTHAHPQKQEAFIVLKGRVYISVGQRAVIAEPGDAVVINNGIYHYFIGLARESVMVEASTHHDDNDVVRASRTVKLNRRQVKDLVKSCRI
jgi:mannose-6-phosphate isomerase-like protein (cupin superfamily)